MDADFHREHLLDEEFSFPAALSMAQASALAYEVDELLLRSVISGWGLETAAIFNEADTEGFIAQDDELVILAFRGTVSTTDWLRNLKISRKESPLGKIHRGFQEGLDAVWDDPIETVLRELAGSDRKVWITGHSLGGALATLAAARASEWLDIAGVYTFGQPLVGNRRFAKLFNRRFRDRFHRFVNDGDIVPKVPPAPLYAHVDQRFHFDTEGGIIEEALGRGDGDEAEPEALSEDEFELMQEMLDQHDQLAESGGADERGLLPELPFMSGIADHNMANGYIPKLRKQVEALS